MDELVAEGVERFLAQADLARRSQVEALERRIAALEAELRTPQGRFGGATDSRVSDAAGVSLSQSGRVRQILSVLVIDYGLGSLFDQLDLGRFRPLGAGGASARCEGMTPAKRLRLALAALGPSFIKLGQILSARPDLLPPEMITELRQLQDQGPTVPFAQIRDLIESELGHATGATLRQLRGEPLSSASLGQVHVATLLGGREVIVKVLRPGVEEVVEADLQVFQDAANLVDRQVPSLAVYDLPGFVRQFKDQIHAEMIYTVEAHNSERVRQHHQRARPEVDGARGDLVPHHASRADHGAGAGAPRGCARRLASAGPTRVGGALRASSCCAQIFVDGFFHGDPHQGNVLVTPTGRLAVLDWGIVGYLDPKTRDLMSEVLRTLGRQDVDAAVAAVVDLGTPRLETDLVSLRQALARIIIHSEIMPTKAFSLGEMLSDVIRAMSQHQIRTPMELSLAAKALIVGEGVATDLDPHFDFREVVQPIVDEERERRNSPDARLAHATQTAANVSRHLARLPGRVDTILSLLERGTVKVRLEDPEADRRVQELSRSLNRIALSLLASFVILTGALYMVFSHRASHAGLGVALLLIGAFLGTAVALALLRWKRI